MIKACKGNIIYTPTKDKFECMENGYIIYEDGKVKGTFKTLPNEYQNIEVEDFGDKLIIPAFVDLHLHAPQWLNKGIGYSEELLPWLNKYTFPLETKFENIEFAEKYYRMFINEMIDCGTTRACIFSSRHYESTKLLIELLKKSGIGAYVGKVNMDRNSTPELQEKTQDSIDETIKLVKEFSVGKSEDELVKYILTPRFVPSTTPELMTALGEIADKYDLPLQSHLDENVDEVEFVKQLHPDIESFTKVYETYNLLRQDKTIMAHCIHNTDEEIEILKKYNVFVAHCPLSNFNLASGLMPTRKYLEQGINIGLGSDISGGHSLYMPISCIAAVSISKMYYTVHRDSAPLSFSEAFYLGTKGGGKFFGKVGSFEDGYDFDALVIDTSGVDSEDILSVEERLEKFIYTGTAESICKRFCRGNVINRI